MVSIPQSNTYNLTVFGGGAFLGVGACAANDLLLAAEAFAGV
jgi:hypothetical protein